MRHFPIAIMLTTLLFVPGVAQADDRDEALAAVQACREISADTVRLACLDAATRLLDGLAPTVSPPTTSPDAAAISQERAQLAAEREALAQERKNLEQLANTNAEAERLSAQREALETERTKIARDRAALEATKKEQVAAAEAAAAATTLRTTGAASVPVTIDRITVNRRSRIHTLYTSDGDIIRQDYSGSNFKAPSSLPAAAKVTRSRVGSRWIAFDQHPNRSIKVTILERRAPR